MRTTMLLAAAASLSAGAALAQATNPPHVDMPVKALTGQLAPTVESAPTPGRANTAVTAPGVTYPDVATVNGEGTPYRSDNVSGPTSMAKVVTSKPVPDTAATRSLYRPLSRAGQRTAAAGD